MATWLIPANIQPLKLYWIREKGARRNALLLLKPSRIPARKFWEQSQGQFQCKALYMEIDKWGVLAETVDAGEPHPRVEGDRV